MKIVNISGPYSDKAIANGVAERRRQAYETVTVVRKTRPISGGKFDNFVAPIVSWYVHFSGPNYEDLSDAD